MDEPDPLIGQTVGEFKILRLLGAGGMGKVYLAEQTSLKRKVAIKVLPQHMMQEQATVDRFEREAMLAAQLTHPNVAQVYTIGSGRNVHFVAMEFIGGGDVYAIMKGKGRIPVDEGAEMLRQALLGLASAHSRGIIHRDLKPQNLMMSEDGIIKVADFGLARAIEAHSSLTASGTVLGTPLYMSPEQAHSKEVDRRTDIYGLGATFYHMICGRPPFEGDTPISVMFKHVGEPLTSPKEIDPDFPEELCTIVEKMMAKKPADRYQTCEEVLTDLMPFCQAHPVPFLKPMKKAEESDRGSALQSRVADREGEADKTVAVSEPDAESGEKFPTIEMKEREEEGEPAGVDRAAETQAAPPDYSEVVKAGPEPEPKKKPKKKAKKKGKPEPVPEAESAIREAQTQISKSHAQRLARPGRRGRIAAQEAEGRKRMALFGGTVLAAALVIGLIYVFVNREPAERPDPGKRPATSTPTTTPAVTPVADTKGGPAVYTQWPFDAAEAKRRQEETAKALGLPVEKTIKLPRDVEMKFVLIPAGEFEMGATEEKVEQLREEHKDAKWIHENLPNEAPRHRVRISRPFYLGKHEVKQGQWQVLADSNPSKWKGRPSIPVGNVSWEDAQNQFIQRLNLKASTGEVVSRSPAGDEDTIKGRFSLPSEAQWEYACRAGTATDYFHGDEPWPEGAKETLNGYAWHGGNWESVAHITGDRKPNAWGLHDMHGNFWEWTADFFDANYYRTSPKVDPVNTRDTGKHVLRGGCCWDSTPALRSSFRTGDPPGREVIGLRLELSVPLEAPDTAPSWARGCVLAYSFDGDTLYDKGGKRHVRDLSGRGHDGELVGGTTAEGHSGQCVQLNGRGEHVTLGHVEALNFTKSQPFTYLAWVRPAGGNDDGRSTIMGKIDGGPGGAQRGDIFQFDVKDGHFIWEGVTDTRKGFDTRTKVAWQPGRWHLAAVTYDGSGLTAGSRLYLNGEPLEMKKAEPTEIPGDFRSDADFRLGGRAHQFGGARYFLGGEIDETAVWSRALSAQEIKALYDYSKTGNSYCEAIGRVAGAAQDAAYTNPLGMKLIRIPAGEFMMGSTPEEIAGLLAEADGWARTFVASEVPRHQVRIRRDFLMGRFEVTRGQYERFVEATGYVTVAEKQGGCHTSFQGKWQRVVDCNWRQPYFEQTDEHPVVCLAFADTQAFCHWLNQYDTTKPEGFEYRLPTEAEWEYAARGPRSLRYPWGNDWDGTKANWADKSSGLKGEKECDDGFPRSSPVGSYSPHGDSPFGISDLVGNAGEWCLDWYDAQYYQRSPVDDPVNAKAGNTRAVRSGDFGSPAPYCHPTRRWGLTLDSRHWGSGFRVVLSPVRQ